MRCQYLRYNWGMNKNDRGEAPTQSNSEILTAILDGGELGYSYRREQFLKKLAFGLADEVDAGEFNAAVVQAAFFAE